MVELLGFLVGHIAGYVENEGSRMNERQHLVAALGADVAAFFLFFVAGGLTLLFPQLATGQLGFVFFEVTGFVELVQSSFLSALVVPFVGYYFGRLTQAAVQEIQDELA